MGYASVIFLPLFYQFIDMSNWQRILAISQRNSEKRLERIENGLKIYAIESPFSWISILALGILLSSFIQHANIDINQLFIELPTYLISSVSLFENIIGYLYILSILSIMLSTIDSVLVATQFTFIYDVFPKTKKVLDKKNYDLSAKENSDVLQKAKLFTPVVILSGVLAYIIFDYDFILKGTSGETFLSMLLSFYTAMLSFFPAVYGAIFLKKNTKNRMGKH